jgi:hypothetical protein
MFGLRQVNFFASSSKRLLTAGDEGGKGEAKRAEGTYPDLLRFGSKVGNIAGPVNARTTDCVLTENSMALVRERTIPTERPPLVGEVCANFCR